MTNEGAANTLPDVDWASLATLDGTTVRLSAVVASLDGTRLIKGEQQGTMHEALEIGKHTARVLLDQGAAALLAEAAQGDGSTGGQLA